MPRIKNEEEYEEEQGTTLKGYRQQNSNNTYTFFIDGEIGPPENYRDLIQTLRKASENDLIEIMLNTPGGRLDSAQSIINAIHMSSASVVGIVNVEACSAGSMIALQCPNLVILPDSILMLHPASYGTYGNSHDNKVFADFINKRIRILVNNYYKDFLSEKEIEELLTGKTFWMQEPEIIERLDRRQKVLQEQINESQEPVVQKHKVKAKKSTKKTQRGI